jgi:hypothetical protein
MDIITFIIVSTISTLLVFDTWLLCYKRKRWGFFLIVTFFLIVNIICIVLSNQLLK